MIYFTLAVLLLIVVALIYNSYKKSNNKEELFKSILYVLSVLFFTYITKAIIIHKPIFVLHLALVLLSWGGLFLYLVKDRLNIWMIFAPIVSTVLFFSIALFFRENG